MTIRPSGTLPLVEFWSTGGPAIAGVIAPDGCMDLVTDGDVVVVAGADTVARFFEPGRGDCPMWGVRFHPGLLPGLLAIPAHAVTDEVVDIRDLCQIRISPEDLIGRARLQTVLAMERRDPAPLAVAA